MRIFVRHDANGQIVSVLKAAVVDASVTEPHGDLADGEGVFELEPAAELEALECHEFHERYKVDVDKKKLRKRGR